MELNERREWKRKVEGVLAGVPHVNGVGLGKYGVVIRIERDSPSVRQEIMNIMERVNPALPYSTQLVERVVKLGAA